MSGRLSALALVASASAAVASLAWWAFSAAEVAEPGPPTGLLGPVIASEARLPPIGDFERFHTTDANPFVPAWERERVGSVDQGGGAGGRIGIDPRRTGDEPPQLSLPTPAPLRGAAFGCVGVIAAHGRETVLVRLPGGATRPIAVGEAVPVAGGWVLEALEPGGVARFRDGAGAVERLPVGDSVQVASARDLR